MSKPTADERFWAKVDKSAGPDGCWPWTGARQDKGYGLFSPTHSRQVGAHRVAYELTTGQIPDGMVIDHLCRNPPCVNPAHLEPVTSRENLLRGTTLAAANATKTHCDHGHEFTPENTRITKPEGKRICRTCAREWMRRRRAVSLIG
jgi:hypothetical protein